jgi:hypothetical protein
MLKFTFRASSPWEPITLRPAHSSPTACAALSATGFQFPQAVSYQDGSSPFRIDATLGQRQIAEGGSGNSVDITVASGTLRDSDKGNFQLAGVVLTTLVAGEMTPMAVVNPGPLSELQQEGLLDAVSTYLNVPAVHYEIATAGFGSGGTKDPAALPGLLVSAPVSERNGSNSQASLLISGDLFVSRAVLPGLAAALGDFSLLWCVMSIEADKLVTTGKLGRTSSEGIAQTFTARCSHSARFDADSRRLLFVEDINPSEPAVDRAGRALASAVAAASTKSVTRVEVSRVPEPLATSPVSGTFRIDTAALAGAVCLQGNWS